MKTIFTWITVLLPILSIYTSPVKGVDLGTFCLLLTSPVLVAGFIARKRTRPPLFMLLMVLYILIGSLCSLTIGKPIDLRLSLLRMGKFVLVVVIVFVVGREIFFDYGIAKKALKFVTIAAVSYIIIQTVMFYAKGTLLPSVAFNYIQNEAYANIDYYSAAIQFYRPTSFFLEPAHFSQYVLLCLAYSLFGDYGIRKTDFKMAVFITVGLILSTSGQGILLAFLLWGIWWCNRIRRANFAVKIYLIGIAVLLCIVVVLVICQTSIFRKSMERLVTPSGSLGSAVGGRLFTYEYYNHLPMLEKIIGTGYGNVPTGVYLNGISYVLYCNGIIGLVLVCAVFFDAFIHTRYCHKCACLVYALLMSGSAAFTATGMTYYFMFIYCGYEHSTSQNSPIDGEARMTRVQ